MRFQFLFIILLAMRLSPPVFGLPYRDADSRKTIRAGDSDPAHPRKTQARPGLLTARAYRRNDRGRQEVHDVPKGWPTQTRRARAIGCPAMQRRSKALS